MGLFDFVKDAGEKIFGKDEEAKAAPEVKHPSPEDVKRFHDRRKGALLAESVTKIGLEVEDLAVKVDGDLATVSGKVASQIDREKVVLVVGNTAGIARVDDRLEVEAQTTMYTVQSGDSLSKIAKQHYGDPMKYPVIFEANKPMLEHPDKIYPGQVLRIPPLEG